MILTAVTCASLFGQRSYTATPIQANGFVLSSLTWLSDNGNLGVGAGLASGPNGTTVMQCLRYSDGTFNVISQPGEHCSASAANSAGDFTGTFSSLNGSEMNGFLYHSGEYRSLAPTLWDDTQVSMATGVNRRGEVVGYYFTNPRLIAHASPDSQYAFRYYRGQAVQLPTLGGAHTEAVGINDKGDAVGSSDLPATEGVPLQTHAVVFPRAGGIIDLGSLGGYSSRAAAINAEGQVAGLSTTASDANYHAFFYEGDTMTPIHLPGIESRAVSVNNSGEVVGVYRFSDYDDHPFYFVNGTAYDLNDLVENPPPGMSLTTPQFINNSGQILVMGVMPDNSHGLARRPTQFLLTPVNTSSAVR